MYVDPGNGVSLATGSGTICIDHIDHVIKWTGTVASSHLKTWYTSNFRHVPSFPVWQHSLCDVPYRCQPSWTRSHTIGKVS